MKKLFTFLLAVAALTVVSCEKEQEEVINNTPENGLVKVSVLAHSPELNGDTKTSLADNGSLYWSYGDHICVWDGTACRDFESDVQQEAEPTKTALFSGEIQSGATDFKAVYPYTSSVSYSEGMFVTSIPATQYAVAGSFANQANVAVSNGATDVDADEDFAIAQFRFSNVGALVKFTISQDGVHKGVTIKAFTKAGEVKTYAKIAGEIQITPATAAATITENSVDAVSVEAASGYLAAGDYYAVILPIDAKYLSFSFTDGYNTKTRSAKTAVTIGRSFYYDMGTIDVGITYPDRFVGEWVITGIDVESQTTYKHILSKYENANYYPAPSAVSIDAENEVVTVSGAKTNYKVTIAKVEEGTYEGMYTIKDGGDKYLTAYSTSSNYLKGVASNKLEAGSYWDISEEGGLYTIVASKFNGRNHLRVNHNVGDNPRFSCYGSTSERPKVTLYPYAKVIAYTANPSISCTNNTITITCDTPGATIYYEIGTNVDNTPDPTTASNVYDDNDKPTINANSYVKAYAIASGYEASSIVGQAVEYIAPGAEAYYMKVAAAPYDGNWSGTYLIVGNTSAANGTITSKWLKYEEVSITTDDKILSTSTVDANAVTIEKVSNQSYYTILFDNGKYLGSTNVNDGIKVVDSIDSECYWSFSFASNLAKIILGTSSTGGRHLRLNGTSGFRTYDGTTGTQATLYKLQDTTPRTISITQPANGSIVTKIGTNVVTTAKAGDVITVVATPADNYDLGEVSVIETESGDPVSVTNNQFTMPACEVTVSATFVPKYAISKSASNGAIVTKIGTDEVTSAKAGVTITVETTPAENYLLSSVTVTKTVGGGSVTMDGNTFVMPSEAVTVTATFVPTYAITKSASNGTIATMVGTDEVTRAKAGETITVETTPAENYVLSGVAVTKTVGGGSVTMDGNTFVMPDEAVNVTATFVPTYAITLSYDTAKATSVVAKVGGSVVTRAKGGDSVTIEVTAKSGYTVAGINSDDVEITDGGFVMPNKAVTVTVTFDGTGPSAPAVGTTMWAETWTGATTATSASNGATPSANYGKGTTVYNSGTVTYTQSATSVYVRNDTYAGGSAPELMLTANQTWTISNIPTGGVSELTLTYKSNNTNSSVSCPTNGASISGSSKSYTITTGGASTITLVFSSAKNTRIDDASLVVKTQ